MKEETRFRLNSFRGKEADIQRERLDKLIADVEGPLRAYRETVNGNRILYLGVRTWPQYFEEFFFTHIVCMPEKIAEIKKETRAAIAQYIEPHLIVQAGVQNAIQNQRHAVELMDMLYMRVDNSRVCADYFARKRDCETSSLKTNVDAFAGTKSIRPGGCFTVPKGLSIARIAPAKINADVRILAKPDTIPHARTRQGDDDHRESKIERDGTGMQHGKENAFSDIATSYASLLEEQAAGKKTVVLQLLSNASLHWFVAHTVSTEFIRDAGRDKPSIMLVPPDPEQHPSNEILRKLSDKAWLDERIENLKHPEGLPPSRASGDQQRKDEKHVPKKFHAESRFHERKYSRPKSEGTDLEISNDEE